MISLFNRFLSFSSIRRYSSDDKERHEKYKNLVIELQEFYNNEDKNENKQIIRDIAWAEQKFNNTVDEMQGAVRYHKSGADFIVFVFMIILGLGVFGFIYAEKMVHIESNELTITEPQNPSVITQSVDLSIINQGLKDIAISINSLSATSTPTVPNRKVTATYSYKLTFLKLRQKTALLFLTLGCESPPPNERQRIIEKSITEVDKINNVYMIQFAKALDEYSEFKWLHEDVQNLEKAYKYLYDDLKKAEKGLPPGLEASSLLNSDLTKISYSLNKILEKLNLNN